MDTLTSTKHLVLPQATSFEHCFQLLGGEGEPSGRKGEKWCWQLSVPLPLLQAVWCWLSDCSGTFPKWELGKCSFRTVQVSLASDSCRQMHSLIWLWYTIHFSPPTPFCSLSIRFSHAFMSLCVFRWSRMSFFCSHVTSSGKPASALPERSC